MPNRLRFAPSPTGDLHVGNARTAVFNWLFVKKYGGSLVIRIEDTDRVRSERRFEDLICRDLQWLGLDWQEGPDCGGPFGPYRQSSRTAIYAHHAESLLETGAAYRCFCSEEELGRQAREARRLGAAWKYPGTCRDLSASEVARRLKDSHPSVIRLRVRSGKVVFEDLVHGEMKFDSAVLGDPILVRSNGIPTYNYAAVVDDGLMKISHVVRGDDHLSNTPRQVLIYEELGWPLPVFAHLSTILGPDRTRLSKRHRATSLQHFRDQGVLPEALLNYLTLLGWAPGEDQDEILSPEELVESFDIERVSKSPAVFDSQKLYFFNRHYLKECEPSRAVEWASAYLRQAGLLEEVDSGVRQWVGLVVEAFLPGMDHLSQISQKAPQLWSFEAEEAVRDEGVRQVLALPGAARVVEELRNQVSHEGRDLVGEWSSIVQSVKAASGQRGRKLFHPIRVALTGKDSGPELDKLVPIFEGGSQLELPHPIKDCRTRINEFHSAMHSREPQPSCSR
jgi:glutamyl-tRNA synthetase/nondiscriminating glutamyl-tRNA synthetase